VSDKDKDKEKDGTAKLTDTELEKASGGLHISKPQPKRPE
jgi:hypothetical protein